MPAPVKVPQVPEIKFRSILERIMEERELSVSEVSRGTTIPEATIRAWMDGRRTPSNPQSIWALADFLKVSYTYLVFGKDDVSYKIGMLELKVERARAEAEKAFKRVLKE